MADKKEIKVVKSPATIATAYIKKEKLEEILKTLNAKGEKGFAFNIAISDSPNQWGQNVSCYKSQSKEEREEKKAKYYFANGQVVWQEGADSYIFGQEDTPSKPKSNPSSKDDDDLPF